jgi:hypothetical protein
LGNWNASRNAQTLAIGLLTCDATKSSASKTTHKNNERCNTYYYIVMHAMLLVDLPIELLHRIYDSCPIQDKAKLNIALGPCKNIKYTTLSNPTKDKQLKYISMYVKCKRITHTDQLPLEWRQFIKDNMSDPTIEDLSTHMTVKCAQRDSLETLLYDIKHQDVPYAKRYTLPKTADTANDVIYAIAKYADPKTFDSVAFHNKDVQEILTAVLNGVTRSRCHDFMFTMITQRNKTLFEYIVKKYHALTFVTTGLDFILSFGCKYLVTMKDSIKLIHEVIGLDDFKKQELLQVAIEKMQLDTADYLVSVGARLL